MSERVEDQRRLRTSALISVALWAVFMPVLALLKFEGPLPPPESMNPLFIELAPPEAPRAASERPAAAPAEADTPETARTPEPSAPAAGGDGRTVSDGAAGEAATPAALDAASPVPALRADPSAAPLPSASRAGRTSTYQGGADPFAPLSEESLKGDEPAAPVRTAAPAARTATPPAKTTSRPEDSFDRSLRDTSERLAAGDAKTGGVGAPSGGGTPAGARTEASGSAGTGQGTGRGALPGAGDLSGGLDFGGGPTRELYSPRRIRVPDRLLAGKPNDLSARVSFIVESGGTVLADTIRFDPPFPQDLDAFLKTAFSSWLFSPADSDGQVVFRYSIKVR